eukprot:Awhi_evm1s2261
MTSTVKDAQEDANTWDSMFSSLSQCEYIPTKDEPNIKDVCLPFHPSRPLSQASNHSQIFSRSHSSNSTSYLTSKVPVNNFCSGSLAYSSSTSLTHSSKKTTAKKPVDISSDTSLSSCSSSKGSLLGEQRQRLASDPGTSRINFPSSSSTLGSQPQLRSKNPRALSLTLEPRPRSAHGLPSDLSIFHTANSITKNTNIVKEVKHAPNSRQSTSREDEKKHIIQGSKVEKSESLSIHDRIEDYCNTQNDQGTIAHKALEVFDNLRQHVVNDNNNDFNSNNSNNSSNNNKNSNNNSNDNNNNSTGDFNYDSTYERNKDDKYSSTKNANNNDNNNDTTSNIKEFKESANCSNNDNGRGSRLLRKLSSITTSFSNTSFNRPTRSSSTNNKYAGYFEKQGFIVKNWKLRWFVLDVSSRQLLYYTDQTLMTLKGIIDLSTISDVCEVTPTEESFWSLALVTPARTFYLRQREKSLLNFFKAKILEFKSYSPSITSFDSILSPTLSKTFSGMSSGDNYNSNSSITSTIEDGSIPFYNDDFHDGPWMQCFDKLGDHLPIWQARFVTIDVCEWKLYVSASLQHAQRKRFKEIVLLDEIVTVIVPEQAELSRSLADDLFHLCIIHKDDRRVVLRHPDKEVRDLWLHALQYVTLNHSN